jgi:hypothetical protein
MRERTRLRNHRVFSTIADVVGANEVEAEIVGRDEVLFLASTSCERSITVCAPVSGESCL